MRLSEAIRLGAMLGPQTRGTLRKQQRQNVATCAWGPLHVQSVSHIKSHLFPFQDIGLF
jgi:hypothetical protein